MNMSFGELNSINLPYIEALKLALANISGLDKMCKFIESQTLKFRRVSKR